MTDEESQAEASISPDHPLYLSDEKWRELSHLTKFPDSQRQKVQNLLFFAKSLAEGDRADAQRARRKVIREAAEVCRRLTALVHEVRERNVIYTDIETEQDNLLIESLSTFEADLNGRIRNFRSGPVSDGFYFVVDSYNDMLVANLKCVVSLAKKRADGFHPEQFLVRLFEMAGAGRGERLRTKVRNHIKEIVEMIADRDPDYRPGKRAARNQKRNFKREPRNVIQGWMFRS